LVIGKSNKNGDHIANVNVNKELQDTEKSMRSTRHLEISLPDGINYGVGDHLEVWAENSDEIVENVASSFGLVLDSVFEIKKIQNEQLSLRSLANAVKGPCTIRNALKYYADLSAPPTKTLLKSIAYKLKETNPESYKILSNILQLGEEGNEAYNNFIKKYIAVHDLQEDYPVELSLEEVLCGLQVITPRRYSISSSPKVFQKEVHIVCKKSF
jgi:cytochrome P450 / NADPH-cytochrome P450 reductase